MIGTLVAVEHRKGSAATRYGYAVLVSAAALLVTQAVSPWLGPDNSYHAVWAVVALSAWYLGLGPTIAVATLGLLGVWYWFLPPNNSLLLEPSRAVQDISGMVTFVLLSALVIAVGESTRRTAAKLKLTEFELRAARDQLETKVEQRTEELTRTVALLESEVATRKSAEEQLRSLSAGLLQAQDDERRRVARELHDSTGQTLAALKISLGRLERFVRATPETCKILEDLNALAEQATNEIRNTSHLLHPPLLDEVGFAFAAEWYLEEFAKRSGIKARLDIVDGLQLNRRAELVLFRVVQEGLTNVLRHSGSPSVDVIVRHDEHDVYLSIKDCGRGIPEAKLNQFRTAGTGVGVGLAGMKARMRELGGTLALESDDTGTLVTATLPLKDNTSCCDESEDKAKASSA